MKMKVKCSEVHKYQQEAENKMEWLEGQYTKILTPVEEAASPWVKFKLLFHFPLSLRMYYPIEHVSTGTTKETAKTYRKVWHNYWGILNQFSKVPNNDTEIWLDSYESETILTLREFK